MTRDPSSNLPPLLREILDEWAPAGRPDGPETDEVRTMLNRLFEQGPAPNSLALFERLHAAGAEYAPFIERAAALYCVDVSIVLDWLRPRDFKQGLLPGMQIKELKHPSIPANRAALLVRFAAGFLYPEHRHEYAERVLVLEGGYTDSGGQRYVAGDQHDVLAGSAHALRVDTAGPCVVAVLSERKIEFTSFWLRMWARLVGW